MNATAILTPGDAAPFCVGASLAGSLLLLPGPGRAPGRAHPRREPRRARAPGAGRVLRAAARRCRGAGERRRPLEQWRPDPDAGVQPASSERGPDRRRLRRFLRPMPPGAAPAGGSGARPQSAHCRDRETRPMRRSRAWRPCPPRRRATSSCRRRLCSSPTSSAARCAAPSSSASSPGRISRAASPRSAPTACRSTRSSTRRSGGATS